MTVWQGPLTPQERQGWVHPDALDRVPPWLHPFVRAATGIRAGELTRFLPPPEGGRRGAVLILAGDGPRGPDLLIIERARDMRSHPGQPAFPGGAVDPEDGSTEAAALREAQEETGLDPAGVTVWGALPAIWLPPSGFVVNAVLGYWHRPSAVSAVDPAEVASVHRVPWSHLLDPQRRVRVSHPSGYIGPGFEVGGLLVWGFTGMLIDGLFRAAGLEQPWQPGRLVELPEWAT